jgi:hypothetical protein
VPLRCCLRRCLAATESTPEELPAFFKGLQRTQVSCKQVFDSLPCKAWCLQLGVQIMLLPLLHIEAVCAAAG